MVNKEEIKMELIPDYGDIFTIKQFLERVDDTSFIDYDGHGNLATKTEMSDIVIYPSTIKKLKIDKKFTHVIWFNR